MGVKSQVQLALLAGILFVSSRADGLSPEESLRAMKVADGFSVKLAASEPEIRQPLSISFDERGRMWVIQYLQYPTPAGLKAAKVDQYLRTTYDHRPEPPPRGPKGADRITICEDTDGDGRMDQFKDFVSGLNLCSGMALGRGGLFVVQPPYLLFYADKNRDDIPDGDPEVLLTGFGMEDAHAFANSLAWGPDGWLYGAQGSTVTANIRGIEFQQGIWRYHPVTRAFELFAEGGGNTWGLDFDGEGELFAGTNFYEKMLHQVQGAYYVKNFGKHGALHNPNTYGYFEHVPYSGYKGLHISIGGIVYHGRAFGKEFEGKYIFGNTLDHAVYWANLHPNGSTFAASHGGTLLKTDDELFRPVDCTISPDGAVYVADWCDKRATHVDPLDTWDRSNGRIYRIESNGAPKNRPEPFRFAEMSSERIVDLLSHSNDWVVREARQVLASRADATILPRLRKQISHDANGPLQLQSLWALYVSGGFDDGFATKLLPHTNKSIRKWTIRFLGDAGKISDPQKQQLIQLAKTETHGPNRAQLACSAKRLSGPNALPIIRELLLRAEDVADTQIPLLLWWALEKNAISSRAEVLDLFSNPQLWKSALVQKHILERLARRYTMEGGEENFAACVKLLEVAEREGNSQAVLRGIEQALEGRALEKTSPAFAAWLSKGWPKYSSDDTFLRVAVRLGSAEAQKAAIKIAGDDTSPEPKRAEYIETLGQIGRPQLLAPLLEILTTSKTERIRTATLNALQHFPDRTVAKQILQLYPDFDPALRQRARNALVNRPSWAEMLVGAVESNRIPSSEISIEQARQMASLRNPELSRRVEKIWGKLETRSPAAKQNTINELKLVLKPSGVAGRDAKGNPDEGRKIFQQACAICHKLFDEGNAIGPDLTGADRKNMEFMLANIVNPNGSIRPEFVSQQIELKDDQIFQGLMVESTPGTVTLVDGTNQRHIIRREQIREMKESQTSLMPEGLLEAMQPQQIMDLFSYLQKD